MREARRLNLNPAVFGALPEHFPAGFKDGHMLSSSSEIQSFARQMFEAPKDEEEVDKSLNSILMALPRLNAMGAELKNQLEQRANNSDVDKLKYRQFSVGNVVMHTETGARAIVVGYEIDDALGEQYLKLLIDQMDAAEYLKAGHSLLLQPNKEGTSMSQFTLVENPYLQRLYHDQIYQYFDGFDHVDSKYIPNSKLLNLYPTDEIENAEDNEKDQSIVEEEASTRVAEERKMAYVIESFTQTLDAVNVELQAVLDKYDIEIDAEETTHLEIQSDKLGNNTMLNNLFNSNSEELRSSISKRNAYTGPEATKSILSYTLSLMATLKAQAEDLKSLQAHPDAGVDPSKSLFNNREVFLAISTLSKTLIEAEKLLTLRFQSKGYYHFEREIHNRKLDGADDKVSSSDSSESSLSTDDHDQTPPMQPPVFRIGEVVKHKKFGYRAAIIANDIRPAADVSKWEGVVGLPSGAEQPFYTVIPDEGDVEDFLGNGAFRTNYYVAEENLELYDTSKTRHHKSSSLLKSQEKVLADDSNSRYLALVESLQQTWQIKHRYMNLYFNGYDVEQGRYVPIQKLLFSFPDNFSGDVDDVDEGDSDEIDAEIKAAHSSNSDDENGDAIDKTQAKLAEMESNLKNILASVNSKQVGRLRKKRQQFLSADMKHKPESKDISLAKLQANTAHGHHVAENALMDIYKTIKRVFSRCREEGQKEKAQTNFTMPPAKGSSGEDLDFFKDNSDNKDNGVPLMNMRHLLYLLKTSRRREDALRMEATIWKVWMAHEDHEVTYEMMNGVNSLRIGKMADALTYFQNASAIDPTYSEPWNKIAVCHNKADEHLLCAENAEKCIELCNNHYGALAGLAMSLEKNGDLHSASECMERALEAHPFAGHIPTVLASIIKKLHKERQSAVEKILYDMERKKDSDSDVEDLETVQATEEPRDTETASETGTESKKKTARRGRKKKEAVKPQDEK